MLSFDHTIMLFMGAALVVCFACVNVMVRRQKRLDHRIREVEDDLAAHREETGFS